MLNKSVVGVALALLLSLSIPLSAEEGILVVHVADTKGKPVVGVVLSPQGDGAGGPPTDKTGKTRVHLAPATRPGQWVSLQIVPGKGGPDWVFISPWNQRALVPSFANESENFVPVVLGKRGDRDLLVSDQAVEAVTARILEKLSPKLDKSEITDEERKRVLSEQAAAFGFKPEEVDEAIRALGAKAKDPYKAGLAALYEKNYPKATEYLSESLEVRRQELAETRARVAEAALFLGKAFYEQGKYREAATAYRELLEVGGEDSLWLNNFALALLKGGDPRSAEAPFKRSLELLEKTFGAEHQAVATSLDNLAGLYQEQGRHSEAEPLSQRSLRIREKVLGGEHLDVATSLNNLAALYQVQDRYSEAEPLFQRSLKILEKIGGGEHPDVAASLSNLAALYQAQGRYSEAEPLFQRSLKILEKIGRGEHPDVAVSLNNLAGLYDTQGRYSEAELLYERSLKIREEVLGADHPAVAVSLNNLAGLYNKQGRYSKAEPLYERSLKIWEKVFGVDHPDVAMSLGNLARLYDTQGRYSEAEPLYERSLKIREKVLGVDHPDVAMSLNNLAFLYYAQEKFDLAEGFARRAVKIAEKRLGYCHPITEALLDNQAAILEALCRNEEAQSLLDRVKKLQNGMCKP